MLKQIPNLSTCEPKHTKTLEQDGTKWKIVIISLSYRYDIVMPWTSWHTYQLDPNYSGRSGFEAVSPSRRWSRWSISSSTNSWRIWKQMENQDESGNSTGNHLEIQMTFQWYSNDITGIPRETKVNHAFGTWKVCTVWKMVQGNIEHMEWNACWWNVEKCWKSQCW